MRAILIDRDGVINEDSRNFIRDPSEFKPLPGSLEAMVRAHRAGWRIVVVSNQSGLARGLFDIAALNAIHARLVDELSQIGGHVDAFFFCPHGPDSGCDCRKPRAGLLRSIHARLGIDLADTVFIGDRITDLEAARSAGVRPFFVHTGLDAVTTADLRTFPGVRACADLSSAIDVVVHGG